MGMTQSAPFEYTDKMRSLLDSWVRVAGGGLCAEAKVRIREEIEDHVQAAYAEFREQGVDEERAFYRAFDQLGSSREARRRYARNYMTTYEEAFVLPLQDTPEGDSRRRKGFVWFAIAWLSAWAIVWMSGTPNSAFVKVAFLLLPLAHLAFLRLIPRIFQVHPFAALGFHQILEMTFMLATVAFWWSAIMSDASPDMTSLMVWEILAPLFIVYCLQAPPLVMAFVKLWRQGRMTS